MCVGGGGGGGRGVGKKSEGEGRERECVEERDLVSEGEREYK